MSASDYAAQRDAMVEHQLQRRGISDPRVLEAMRRVPRERFVLPEFRHEAYSDQALPIACGQTISQPYIVALMTEALQLSGTEKVLEVGTGSGYQAAVLALLARKVVSIERHEELSRRAAQVLQELGLDNVLLVVGDGTKGYPPEAPYDRILVTAAGPEVPPALIEQLAPDGLLVMPVGPPEHQVLRVYRKRGDHLEVEQLCPVRFVPLIPDEQTPPEAEE